MATTSVDVKRTFIMEEEKDYNLKEAPVHQVHHQRNDQKQMQQSQKLQLHQQKK